LIVIWKSPAGVLVHNFLEVVLANFNLVRDAKIKLPASTFGNRCTSAPDSNFPNVISNLYGALGFAPASTSRTNVDDIMRHRLPK
jgi:hypothetical protein